MRLKTCGKLCLALMTVFLMSQISFSKETEEEEGVVSGILTEKGKDWIAVKVDGEAEARRYYPFWIGGTPKQGGGYDRRMMETIGKIFGGNRVKVAWRFEERPRIVSVEMLVSREKSGEVTGTVLMRGDAWIEVKPDKGPAERYMPHWIGGMPADGGGLDQKILQALSGIRVGDRVRLKWEYEERKRVVRISNLSSGRR